MADTVITVSHVSKNFKLPHEKVTTIKSAVVNFLRRNRSYELQHALKDVSFTVGKGDFFAIVGRNGSGKSTMLKMLAGIYSPTAGSIEVKGKLTPFIELGVGFNQDLSGRENVYLNGALLGFNRSEMDAMYKDIVAFAELDRFMDQKLRNYSSGMQVRLAFSIAIRARSDILLLDEVLAVGDAAFQQKCYDYFEELKRENKTVVFVSHDMGAVRRFCNKAVYIDKGVLTASGTAHEIADIYLTDNIEIAQKTARNEFDSVTDYRISSKVIAQSENEVTVEFNYSSSTEEDLYVGISLMRDGIAVAEISTDPAKTSRAKGTLTFKFDTSPLNAGAYQVDAALFKQENRQLLCFTKSKAKFVVKGSDPRRGASLRLEDTWTYAAD